MKHEPPNDPERARRAKEASMSQVDAAADEIWKEYMLDCIYDVAEHMPYFTTDDVFVRYYQEPEEGRPTTHDLRAMGPLMRRAAKMQICIKAEILPVPSGRPTLHSSPIQIWKSLIYKGPRP